METVGDDGLYRQSCMETILCSAKLKVLQWFGLGILKRKRWVVIYVVEIASSGGVDGSLVFFSFPFFGQKKQSYSCGIFVYRLT